MWEGSLKDNDELNWAAALNLREFAPVIRSFSQLLPSYKESDQPPVFLLNSTLYVGFALDTIVVSEDVLLLQDTLARCMAAASVNLDNHPISSERASDLFFHVETSHILRLLETWPDPIWAEAGCPTGVGINVDLLSSDSLVLEGVSECLSQQDAQLLATAFRQFLNEFESSNQEFSFFGDVTQTGQQVFLRVRLNGLENFLAELGSAAEEAYQEGANRKPSP